LSFADHPHCLEKKADPGIPNSFPYKDRILAELATEKRLAEEAKLAKRQANKPAQEEEEDIPGINSVASKVLSASAAIPVKANGKAAATEDDEVPELIDTALTNLQDVLDRADVVLQVVDARDIQGGRSAFIEKLVTDAGGTYGLLVNKVGECVNAGEATASRR
jgi:nuclear GTP-binding protein